MEMINTGLSRDLGKSINFAIKNKLEISKKEYCEFLFASQIIPFSFFNSLIILFSLCFFANFGKNIFSKSVLIRVICGEYFNNS